MKEIEFSEFVEEVHALIGSTAQELDKFFDSFPLKNLRWANTMVVDNISHWGSYAYSALTDGRTPGERQEFLKKLNEYEEINKNIRSFKSRKFGPNLEEPCNYKESDDKTRMVKVWL